MMYWMLWEIIWFSSHIFCSFFHSVVVALDSCFMLLHLILLMISCSFHTNSFIDFFMPLDAWFLRFRRLFVAFSSSFCWKRQGPSLASLILDAFSFHNDCLDSWCLFLVLPVVDSLYTLSPPHLWQMTKYTREGKEREWLRRQREISCTLGWSFVRISFSLLIHIFLYDIAFVWSVVFLFTKF